MALGMAPINGPKTGIMLVTADNKADKSAVWHLEDCKDNIAYDANDD